VSGRGGGRTRRTDDRRMIGGVKRRCGKGCPARGCPSGRHTWAYVVAEPAPNGGRGRKVWVGGYPAERDAKAARRAALVDIDRNRFVRPAPETVGAVAKRWLASLAADGTKPATVAAYESRWRCHLEPALGSRPVGKVTSADLEATLAGLVTDKGLSPRMVRNVAATLSGLMSAAERWRLVQVSPYRHARVPGQRKGRSTGAPVERWQVWTEAELSRFLAGIAALLDAAVSILAAATGMRRGELAGLHWDDVDLDAGSVTVSTNRSRVRLLDGTWATVEGTPKSGRSRTVMLDPATVSDLQALRDAQRSAAVVSLAERRDRGGHVFVTADGKPLSGKQVGCAYDRHVSAVDGLRRPGGVHTLRHTHATLLLAAGEPIATVAKRLGDTIAVVEQTYAHWVQDADAHAATAWAKAVRR